MIRFYLIIILLVACQKEENNLGEEFQRVVGKWENSDGDDRIHITIEASGKIKIEKSTERGRKFKVDKLHYVPSGGTLINGKVWQSYFCYKSKNGENTGIGLMYNLNNTGDSALFNLGTHVETFEAQNHGSFFKRIP